MLCIIMVLIDQVIKYYVFMNKPKIVLIPKVLSITYAQNTGTAFGLAQGSNSILMISSIVIILLILFFIFKKTDKYSIKRKLWELILAGGIGNLIDRICRGFVIDYVSIKFFGVCNLADFCIVVGVVLLAILELRDIIIDKET